MSQQPNPRTSSTPPPSSVSPVSQLVPNTPNEHDAEKSLIGSVLLDPSQLTGARIILKTPDAFFFSRHRMIWEAMSELHDAGEAIDLVTIGAKLQGKKQLETTGGYAYLTQCMSETPRSMNAETYAQIVVRAHARLRLLEAGDAIKELAYNQAITIEEVARKIQALNIPEITLDVSPNIPKTLSTIAHSVMDDVEDAYQNIDPLPGIPAMETLNEFMKGWRPKRVYFIGGRTHMGKSAFMWSQALEAAKAGKRVFFHSCETPENEIMIRMAAMEMNINSDKIVTGDMTPTQYTKFIETMGWLNKLPIHIDYQTISAPRALYDRVEYIRNRDGVDVLFVDHMHQMSLPPEAFKIYRDERQQLIYIAQSFDVMSKRLNLPVIVGAQLNRGASGKRPGAPRMEHFKGTGKIEESADFVLLLHREGYYDDRHDPGKVQMIIPKNRINGKTGTLHARMNTTTAQFVDDEDYLETLKRRTINL